MLGSAHPCHSCVWIGDIACDGARKTGDARVPRSTDQVTDVPVCGKSRNQRVLSTAAPDHKNSHYWKDLHVVLAYQAAARQVDYFV